VVVLPSSIGNRSLRDFEVNESIHVETLGPHPVVEALDNRILHRLAGIDAVDRHAVLAGPSGDLAPPERRIVVGNRMRTDLLCTNWPVFSPGRSHCDRSNS
jgi:hypothetical protein